MLVKEYRISMPLSVEEYRIGQLYMINRHSNEQSESGEGVHVVTNEPCEDEKYGTGQYTEKRVYLSSRLPAWVRSYIPNLFYIVEKAWNYYPYTITEYYCSFLPRFSVRIETKYLDDNGCTENCFNHNDDLNGRDVVHVDIAHDPIPDKYYVEEEDCRYFKSKITGRGPLEQGWQETQQPIMCSYKLVKVSFDIWGLSQRVESYVHKVIQDILSVGHRQAFAWIDLWYEMDINDVRQYEKEMQEKTNSKVGVDEQE
ncbi:cytoplasmic phosphatidylinositol transfer protein 1 [Exaiptasia diaphana]|uniref:Cytoplasmic phosphatidylinositol transfer protein 1 n=1 Tax=Exaiptasia diaphana TaxID=2652724 RepID=A0A913Y8I9_EXADI|nr:cytoplasmic phosphatidylinositol transfer protein 1 [Exaiptasia diaphana]KXJ21707.1 Cytoplasmic phosphatidylinositol transfer protein 1 [Exaiptasia diaphana]